MAAYAALVSLMNNMEQMMTHPRLSTSFDSNQIQTLEEKAGFLLDFIEGYNCGGVVSKGAEDLERQIASAAHAAEDAIESHIVDQILAGSAEIGETSSGTSYLLSVEKKIKIVKKKVRDLKIRTVSAAHAAEGGSNQAGFSCSLHLQQIIEDMDAILKNANELKVEEGVRKEHSTQSRPLMGIGESVMVGFEDELIQLMDELTNQQSSRHIISIVGMGGTGKTTLAQSICKNLLIKQHFDIRAWATLSHQDNLEEILSQLLSGLGTLGESGEQLHKYLYGRRYLIILDDVWSVEAWDAVRRFFPDNGNRSRIVLTTRLANVARDCSSSSFTMKPLDEHTSWKLLCKKAFQQENCPYPQLEKVGKEIVRLCRGLPLSTVLIGGLLSESPRSVEFWENIVRNIKSNPDSQEKQKSLEILSLSYNNLPPHLKPCFLYMGVFKKGSQIRVSRMIKLWVAEGFLKPNNTHMLEEVAEGYLEELIDRNLISVSKHRHNGKVRSCGIHDLLRDLCLKLAEQQEFFHVTDHEILGTERHLICFNWDVLLPDRPLLARSILSRGAHGQPVNRKLLRVWDQGHLESEAEFYVNVNLRYLAYEPVYHPRPVWNLSASLSFIWNLQTLIIKQFSSPTVVAAPIEIWKMHQLRHLKCTNIYVPDPPISDGSFILNNLQTLTTAVNLRLSEEVCKRVPNIKKLHIAYGHRWQEYDDSLIECLSNLDCLHKLESLKLSIGAIKWPERSKILTFPNSLNKLSLSGCLLGWEDLSMIGWLPQLEVLQLRLGPVTLKNEWSLVNEQFLRLKFLKLDCCPLYYWDADSSHFPILEKLVLRNLWHLEEIPPGIGEILTLELIHVDCCSESAAISALKIKEDRLDKQGTDDLQIQVTMFDAEEESFKEMAKMEGLSVDDIQLGII